MHTPLKGLYQAVEITILFPASYMALLERKMGFRHKLELLLLTPLRIRTLIGAFIVTKIKPASQSTAFSGISQVTFAMRLEYFRLGLL
jgi:hypothetical protein